MQIDVVSSAAVATFPSNKPDDVHSSVTGMMYTHRQNAVLPPWKGCFPLGSRKLMAKYCVLCRNAELIGSLLN